MLAGDARFPRLPIVDSFPRGPWGRGLHSASLLAAEGPLQPALPAPPQGEAKAAADVLGSKPLVSISHFLKMIKSSIVTLRCCWAFNVSSTIYLSYLKMHP